MLILVCVLLKNRSSIIDRFSHILNYVEFFTVIIMTIVSNWLIICHHNILATDILFEQLIPSKFNCFKLNLYLWLFFGDIIDGYLSDLQDNLN